MQYLRRDVKREIYRQITNPVPAPIVSGLYLRGCELGLILQEAGQDLDAKLSTLSRVEEDTTRSEALRIRYRN